MNTKKLRRLYSAYNQDQQTYTSTGTPLTDYLLIRYRVSWADGFRLKTRMDRNYAMRANRRMGQPVFIPKAAR